MANIILNTLQVKKGHCKYSLGVQSISKYCSQMGYSVDLLSIPLDISKALEIIMSHEPVVCGFSSNYVTESYVIDIINAIRQEKGGEIIIVVGGPSITYSSSKSRIRQCDADLFVKGYGESPFYQILKNINHIELIINGTISIIGVSSKYNSNESIASINLESVPSLFPLSFNTDHIYWETVRGCAYNCIYCAHPSQLNRFRNVPFERLISDIKYISSKGFRAIYITDPILGGEKIRSKKILKLLKRLKGMFITAEYRPEYLDNDIIDLLSELNIGWLEFGLQTTNPHLKYFRKNSLYGMEQLTKLSKKGIKYSLDLIAGIPGDTIDSFEDSLKYAIEMAKPSSLKVFPLRIYEGTVLHQLAMNNGLCTYDKFTRIIKSSHTFDEKELSNWFQLGRVCSHLYRFFSENLWFDSEDKIRSINFFIPS